MILVLIVMVSYYDYGRRSLLLLGILYNSSRSDSIQMHIIKGKSEQGKSLITDNYKKWLKQQLKKQSNKTWGFPQPIY